ncbi:N-acetylmuramidase domain-containing protein, partial [Burkholderia sola]
KYPALVNPKRGGYAGDAAEYARLASASQISAACALEATSWGSFQIMGFHWKALGYPDVFAFVEAMKVSEAEQLEAFVRFVLADKVMLAALRGKKWAKFA